MPHDTNKYDKPCIIVTGGSGLLGSKLVESLAGQFHVFSMDIVAPDHPLPVDAEFVEIDLTSDESVRDAVESTLRKASDPLASIIHLAAYVDFSGEPSDQYEQVTVKGTERLLRALRGYAVEQFVFSSTMLVHKPKPPGEPITEESEIEGKWDYPRSKIETERIIRRDRGELPAVIFRIAGVYTDHCDSIPIANQIQRLYEKRLTGRVFPGDTNRGQSFLHMDDLLDAFRRVIDRRSELNGVTELLIGEPEVHSYDTLQREFARLIHGDDDWDTHEIPKSVAKSGAWIQGKIPGLEEPFIKPWMIDLADDHYEIDVSKARRIIGWNPTRRLIDTLPAMVGFLKRDPEQFYERHNLDPSNVPEDASAARSGS
ncbi:MAG: NAD-dependent epimerase/dehydratase family protein [Phycisphaerales bacterium]